MDSSLSLMLLYLAALSLLCPENMASLDNTVLGAIFDCSSRVGKEERVAMEMAIRDLNKHQSPELILRLKCSHGRPVQAAQAARYLMKLWHVKAILGPNSWEETSAVAEVGHQHDVPILSLCGCTPPWATARWPLLIQACPTAANQMHAVAAIIESWKWRKVNVIYQDTGYVSSGILNHLQGALRDANVQLSGLVPLSSFVSPDVLYKELEKLKNGECRVFVVHASLGLSERVFRMAKEMEMMEKEYVWIATHSTASLIHSLNASVISSMQGVLGVRRYFPDTGKDFDNFNERFVRVFREKFPEENSYDPGIFAVQAYDATWAVGLAIRADRKQMLERIQETDFNGLSGRIRFHDRSLAPANKFQIINVFGKSYRELGFWSNCSGFSRDTGNAKENSSSMEILGQVFWPGAPPSTPIGWALPMTSNPMRIGVPKTTLMGKYVKVDYDPITGKPKVTGFSIDVFNRTVQKLNYSLTYDFIPFEGKYDELVKKVHLKEFDAAVGDINIVSSRYEYVEFTHAYSVSGLVMVVPIQRRSSRAWLFLKPFTWSMWLLTVFINVFNGFVIWSIEKEYCSELKGSLPNQIVTLIWLAFATLFSLHGGKLHSNLSKMATVVWLFVALILTQSYTASLTSMLTLQNMEPKITNLETLKSQNAYIGSNRVSFVTNYLTEALQWDKRYIKSFATEEAFADALLRGDISAALLEAPDANLFVAKHCKSFIIAGPPYKVGGYAFAFPRGSPLLPDMNKALMKMFESGEEKELEDRLIASEKCVDVQDNDIASLSPHGFFMPFIFTGGTSSVALALFYCRRRWKADQSSIAEHRGIWMLISFVLVGWMNQRRRFSRKVRDLEMPAHYPNP